MNRKLNFALVGCGSMGRFLHLPNLVRHPGIDLRWCCDISEDCLRESARVAPDAKLTQDYLEVLRDPSLDAVLLATPHTERRSMVEQAVSAGKHIYVEKPMADTIEDTHYLYRLVKESGIKFCVGHNRRSAPAVAAAKEVFRKHRSDPKSPAWRLDRNSKGRPRFPEEEQAMVLLRVNDDLITWRPWSLESGMLIGEMCHFIDLGCFFLEGTPVKITTEGSTFANYVITLTMPNGSMSTIFSCSMGNTSGYPKELYELYSHGAVIAVDHLVEMRVAGVVGEPFRRYFPFDWDHLPEVKEQGIEGVYRRFPLQQEKALQDGNNERMLFWPDKGHYAHLDAFVKSIVSDTLTPCDEADGARATILTLKAYDSARIGRPVYLSEEDFPFSRSRRTKPVATDTKPFALTEGRPD